MCLDLVVGACLLVGAADRSSANWRAANGRMSLNLVVGAWLLVGAANWRAANGRMSLNVLVLWLALLELILGHESPPSRTGFGFLPIRVLDALEPDNLPFFPSHTLAVLRFSSACG